MTARTRFSIPRLSARLGAVALLVIAAGQCCAAASNIQISPSVVSKPADAAYDAGWPRVFNTGGDTISVFKPQLSAWDYYTATATAAVAVQAPGAKETAYGIVNIKANTFIDKVERTVQFYNVQVLDCNFPGVSAETKATYFGLISPLFKDNLKAVSLDRLEGQLAILNAQNQAKAVPIKNTPPKFVFATSPTLLISIQGDPAMRAMGDTGVQRVVNTSAFLAQGPAGAYYLHLWDGFLTAPSLTGTWTVATSVPKGVKDAMALAVKAKSVDLLGGKPDPKTNKMPSLKTVAPPGILVATVPTELIVFYGQADWAPLTGTDLLYATNTVANVFMNLIDQQRYVLVSGRWFKAGSLDGPWTFVASKDLPPTFAKIPVTSAKENVLASIAGTPQAQQAVIASQIPQMAKVSRTTTKMPALSFAGVPDLKPIEGTTLKYVTNSQTPVIQVDANTWCVLYNGVWFTGADIGGPWTVATSVPAAIYSIPASSPLHYVTYAKVYGGDDTTALVGYTPGYYGAVVSPDNTVVYGTGYDYPPYVSDDSYVAPPATYGYDASMAWTPWAGWGFGFAAGWASGNDDDYDYYSYSPPAPSWGPYYGWSSGVYANGYGGVTAWGPAGWAATTGNMYSHWGNYSAQYREGAGFNALTGNAGVYQYGHAYNSATGTMVAGQRGAVQNVYTGNYAYGGRGAAYNPYTGTRAAGSRVTVGNADGNQATAFRGAAYNPRTGNEDYAKGIHGQSGGIYDVNGNTFATHDGQVYRPSSQGGYEHYQSPGNWNRETDANVNRTLSNNYSNDFASEQRANSWQNHGYQDAGSFNGGRSFSGDGWGGGDRAFWRWR